MADSVDVSVLGPMDELDKGGFGTVYRLAAFSLPGFTDLAYKQFTNPPGAADVTNLEALVDFRVRLDARSRAILDDSAAWPLLIVTRGGTVCGFVMQLIPADFFGRQTLPSGATDLVPLKSQWLVIDPAKADAAGIVVPRCDDVPARLVLCAKLAHVLGVLHRAGFVYGDLSLNNVIFSAGTPPRVMLVDCDAVQAPSSTPIMQAHTDDWAPPESVSGQRIQDVETDRYKLALYILRVLTPGPHASQAVDPSRVVGVLDFQGNTMTRDGVSADGRARPSAKDWFGCLTQNLVALTCPPRFDAVAVDTKASLAGAMVMVSWTVTGAHRVEVTASDGHTTVCDSPAGGAQCRMAVTRTGPFTLSAINRFGTTTIDTMPVFVLEPPTVARIEVPPVTLPRLTSGSHDLATALSDIREATLVLPKEAVAVPDFSPLRSLATPPMPDGRFAGWSPGMGGAAGTEFTALVASLGADARDVAETARRHSLEAVAAAMRGIG